MEVVRTVKAMQQRADALRAAGHRLILVPTMGALHEGHLTLVRTAHRHGDHVLVSIFVNPTQFGPGEDFDAYPRTETEDIEKLQQEGVDTVFIPSADSMYPHDGLAAGPLTWVDVQELDQHLCGARRPGHFRGVTTVVTKLFLACKPHGAVFGLKDAQQFLILRRMVFDLNLDVELIGVPTVREKDGLALSSRNRYLTPSERSQAPALQRGLRKAAEAVSQGVADAHTLLGLVIEAIAAAPDARVQYVEVVDAATIQPISHLTAGREALIALAVYFGETRLIDNTFVTLPA